MAATTSSSAIVTTPTSSTHPFSLTTPSPPGTIRTPTAPRHGFSDLWDPFPPRKSARLSSRRLIERTPSPPTSFRRRPIPTRPDTPLGALSPPSPSGVTQTPAVSLMATPSRSPRKRRVLPPVLDSSRRASGILTAVSAADAAAALGLGPDRPDQRLSSGVLRSGAGMLLTPAKTPQKGHGATNDKTMANIKAIARNLFHSDDDDDGPTDKTQVVVATTSHLSTTPSGRLRRKTETYTGISLGSFTARDEQKPIRIYTDNPLPASSRDSFYDLDPQPPTIDQTHRAGKRSQVLIPGEGVVDLAAAINRQDGIVYVFRGKKIFRKFAESTDDDTGPDQDDRTAPPSLSRPLTRSQIKPRLLFPSSHRAPVKTRSTADEEAEEAVTDVEDHLELEHRTYESLRCTRRHRLGPPSQKPDAIEENKSSPRTPPSRIRLAPVTPEAPRFGPVTTPPDTYRTTRSGARPAADPNQSPIPRTRADKKSSPSGDLPHIKSFSTERAGDEDMAPDGIKRSKM